jgi:hypothetical protein
MLALMTGAYRMSKRMARTFCADVLGVPVSAGQICASEAQTVTATDAAVQEMRQHVQSQDACVDETGWRQERQATWLWVVVTQAVTVFTVALSRAGSVARGLVDPSARQVITTDRYSGYAWLPVQQRQICWAHLVRDFQAMVDRASEGSQIGEELLCCAEDMFTWWHRVRDGTMCRSTFRRYFGELRPWVRSQLEAGSACRCAKTAGTCRELLAVEPALWTFRARRRHRANQQRGRAGATPRCAMAQDQLRHRELVWQPLRGKHSQRSSDVAPTRAGRSRVPHRVLSSRTSGLPASVPATSGVTVEHSCLFGRHAKPDLAPS